MQVRARLLGHLPLPWESKMRPDVKRKLGSFQKPVMHLLQRDPSQRMTLHMFHAAFKKLAARQAPVERLG